MAQETDSEKVESLIETLANTELDWQTRSEAAKELAEIGDRRAIAPMLAVLNNPTPCEDPDMVEAEYVRLLVASVLGYFGDVSVVEPLIEALAQDQFWQVREAAAGSLGVLKDSRAIETLIKALADDYEKVQYEAAFALRQFPVSEVQAAVERNLTIAGAWAEWLLVRD